MNGSKRTRNRVGDALNRSRAAKVGEILLVFLIPVGLMLVFSPLAGGNPIASQGIAWVANVLMLALIILGLRARGEDLGHFGLSIGRIGLRPALRLLGLSLLVLILAIAAFVLGAIVGVNLAGMPEGADMSGYNYLEGNLLLLLLALPAVFFVSSWGEEVVYRGFLINRLAELSSHRSRWWVATTFGGLGFGLAHYTWGWRQCEGVPRDRVEKYHFLPGDPDREPSQLIVSGVSGRRSPQPSQP